MYVNDLLEAAELARLLLDSTMNFRSFNSLAPAMEGSGLMMVLWTVPLMAAS